MIRPNSQAPVSPNRLKAIKKKKDMRVNGFSLSGFTSNLLSSWQL